MQTTGKGCCGSLLLVLVVVVVVVVVLLLLLLLFLLVVVIVVLVVVVVVVVVLLYCRTLSINTGILVHRGTCPCTRRWFSLQKRLNDLRLELLSEEGRSQVGKDGWRVVGIGDI